jgi:hypothetical protein
MKSTFLTALFLLSLTISAREIELNLKCKSDSKLTLNRIIFAAENTKLYFTYKNDDNTKNKIGLIPPESASAFYIEDVSTKQRYRLLDAEGLPKWFPQQVKFLRRFEEVSFQLIFPFMAPTMVIHVIEGEGNEESNTAWNFKNIEVADVHLMNQMVIEFIQKSSHSSSEQAFAQKAASQFEHIADFLQISQSGNWNAFSAKWETFAQAVEMIDFINKDRLESYIANVDIENAQNYLQKYPNSSYKTRLVTMISDKTISLQRTEYEQVKEKNLIGGYLEFIEKYCLEDCENSNSEFVRDAVDKVKAFFNKRQGELIREGIIENYNNVLKLYQENPFAQKIVNDYNDLAQTAFNKVKQSNKEEEIADFISKFSFSKLLPQAWLMLNKKYDEANKIESYQAYLSKYPTSPHFAEMTTKKAKLQQEKERENQIERLLNSFKATLKTGETVSYRQTYRVKSLSNEDYFFVFEIQYFGSIVNILTKDVRIRVTDSKIILLDANMNETIQDYYDQMRMITIGGLETIPISRLDSFPYENE